MEININKLHNAQSVYCNEGDLVIFRDYEGDIYTCLICRIDCDEMRLICMDDGDRFFDTNLSGMSKSTLIGLLESEDLTDVEIHNSDDVSVEITIK